jgi:hypothetical protein
VILGKTGRRLSPTFDRDEIDINALKWPFLKTKLEVQCAELQKIKVDLTLLFSSAMALGAVTVSEKEKHKRDIPGLQKTRQWAERQADAARRRAEKRSRHSQGSGAFDRHVTFDDPEVYSKFAAFEEQQLREEEERQIKERAATLEAEEKRKEIEREASQKEAGEKAIADFITKQEELKKRNAKKIETLRNELAKFEMELEPAQLQTVIDQLNIADAKETTTFDLLPKARPNESPEGDSLDGPANGPHKSGFSLNFGFLFPWKSSKKRKSQQDDAVNGQPKALPKDEGVVMEAWTIDIFNERVSELFLSQDYLRGKVEKMNGRKDLWKTHAKLQQPWKVGLHDFMNQRRRNSFQDNPPPWMLLHFEVVKSAPEYPILQVIIGQPNQWQRKHISPSHTGDHVQLLRTTTGGAKTLMSTSLVSAQALERLGYSFTIEGNVYVIQEGLSRIQLREILRWVDIEPRDTQILTEISTKSAPAKLERISDIPRSQPKRDLPPVASERQPSKSGAEYSAQLYPGSPADTYPSSKRRSWADFSGSRRPRPVKRYFSHDSYSSSDSLINISPRARTSSPDIPNLRERGRRRSAWKEAENSPGPWEVPLQRPSYTRRKRSSPYNRSKIPQLSSDDDYASGGGIVGAFIEDDNEIIENTLRTYTTYNDDTRKIVSSQAPAPLSYKDQQGPESLPPGPSRIIVIKPEGCRESSEDDDGDGESANSSNNFGDQGQPSGVVFDAEPTVATLSDEDEQRARDDRR